MPSPTQSPTQSARRALSARAAWPVVVGIALVLSWWSLYALAVGYQVPQPLALAVSAVFDGAALVLGDLARRYAMTTDSGLMPRLSMVALVALSGWLNYQHAVVLHLPAPAQIMFATPPLVAGGLFELERRWEHREAMRAVDRVPAALPPLGRWAWLMFPGRTIRAQRALVLAHLEDVVRRYSVVPDQAPQPAAKPAPQPAAKPAPKPDTKRTLRAVESPAQKEARRLYDEHLDGLVAAGLPVTKPNAEVIHAAVAHLDGAYGHPQSTRRLVSDWWKVDSRRIAEGVQ